VTDDEDSGTLARIAAKFPAAVPGIQALVYNPLQNQGCYPVTVDSIGGMFRPFRVKSNE
jgi:hypothetical protein